MEKIGHRKQDAMHKFKNMSNNFTGVETVNFHQSSFQMAPFLKLDLEMDFLEQVVPGGYFKSSQD
jgi:hypothetical protein